MTTTKTTIADPVGIKEIAERLEVSVATVHSWRARAARPRRDAEPLPPPAVILTSTPIWAWATIERWAKATGRL